ncbi:MAG: GTP 3',8-cyclase MoaA [Anaerolineae bacterium]
MKDSFGREINYLRISLTDRCNLRCVYCMPMNGLTFAPHNQLLQPAEIEAVARAAAETGFNKIRLTGGEPTLRRDILEIIERIKRVPGINQVTMTTNGYRLSKLARPMARAGLDRVNIHIDALDPDSLVKTMRLAKHHKIREAIAAAEEAGLRPIKLNVVVARKFNEADIPALAKLTLYRPWHVRFIELMPLGAPAGIALENFVSSRETIDRIEAALGPVFPLNGGQLDGEARLYRIPGAEGTLGFISPVSNPYCGDCNRMRVTADGRIRLCLLSDKEINFKDTLRNGGTHADLVALFRKAVTHKPWGHQLEAGIHPQLRTMSQIGG